MIYDQSLEQSFIAALIHRPNDYLQIESFFDEGDIFAEDGDIRHRSIFTIIKQAVKKNEEIDATIIAQRIKALGFSFEDDDLPIADYVKSLALRNSKEGSVFRLARELKKMSIRRQFEGTGRELIERMNEIPPSCSYSEIIEEADQIFNKQVNQFELDGDVPVDIYAEMRYIVERAGEDQKEPLWGPFETVNKVYGSLVKAGNITTITSRSGSGKTSLALKFCSYIGSRYNIPVLHFDNGEMSKEELIYRQCSAISGVPHYLIETGKWRNAGEETVKKVRSAFDKIESGKCRFFYYCVAGMSVDEMVAFAKRFYYNTVGRGKEMILSFDYIKTTNQLGGNMTEWQVVGEIVDKFKKLVQKDILFEGNPMIGMFTSVQSNRMGVTTNRSSDKIVDDESTVSLSDRIIQFSSHMFILRKKTMDEILEEGEQFGTHKLICIKARHLGEDVNGHLEPVKAGDQLRQNFINLEFKNFQITEKGDLRDIVRAKSVDAELDKGYSSEEEPDF